MAKRTKGCLFGLAIGTIIRAFMVAIEFLSRILAKVLVLFGLWIPLIYAIFGVILYYGLGFNPFDFSLYSTLYLSGAAACVVSSLIISIRNILVRPAKSVYEGYKHPLWEKNREKKMQEEEAEFAEYVVKKKGDKLSPSPIEDFSTKKYRKKHIDYLAPAGDFDSGNTRQLDWQRAELSAVENLPYNVKGEKYQPSLPPAVVEAEKPQVYFSKLEPDLLVHEYRDRFELFRIENRRSVLDRVEYKE